MGWFIHSTSLLEIVLFSRSFVPHTSRLLFSSHSRLCSATTLHLLEEGQDDTLKTCRVPHQGGNHARSWCHRRGIPRYSSRYACTPGPWSVLDYSAECLVESIAASAVSALKMLVICRVPARPCKLSVHIIYTSFYHCHDVCIRCQEMIRIDVIIYSAGNRVS